MPKYRAGLGNVGSYQVAAIPFLTGSGANGIAAEAEHKISFPRVARSITVRNMDSPDDPTAAAPLRVHFNSVTSGQVIAGNHYLPISAFEDEVTLDMKCKEIYVSNASVTLAGTYEVIAELTTISPYEMPILTGSGLTHLGSD